jgi:hypothetical protein
MPVGAVNPKVEESTSALARLIAFAASSSTTESAMKDDRTMFVVRNLSSAYGPAGPSRHRLALTGQIVAWWATTYQGQSRGKSLIGVMPALEPVVNGTGNGRAAPHPRVACGLAASQAGESSAPPAFGEHRDRPGRDRQARDPAGI